MRIKFSYLDLSEHRKNCHPESKKIRRAFEMLDTAGKVGWAYSKYLLSSLDSDFSENEFGACDYLLEEVEKIESGETDSYIYESNGFTHYIGRSSGACKLFCVNTDGSVIGDRGAGHQIQS